MILRSVPLAIVAAGFAQAVVSPPPPPKGETTLVLGTITVVPGRTVRGRVVDEAGAGLRGMDVRLADPIDEYASLGQFRTSLDDGRFAFASVAPGRRLVRVSGRGPDPMETKSDIDVPADADPAPLTIVYGTAPPKPPTKVNLRTRVVDENGEPVRGVPLGVIYGSGGGTFAGGGDGAGVDIDCAQEPELLSTRWASNDPTKGANQNNDLALKYLYASVWLRPGQTSANVVLRRGEPVSGTVVDAEGKPVKQAWIEALIGSRQVGYGYSDAEGRFAFAVPTGAMVDLLAKPTGTSYPPPPDVGEQSGVLSGSTNVTIRIQHVAMDRTLDIVLVMPEGETAGKCDLMVDFQGSDNRNPVRATLDRAGRARLEGLPNGPVSVRVMVRTAADDEKAFTGLTPVRVAAGVESVRIVVPGFRVIRGHVVDESGAPSPNAYLFSTAAANASSVYADAQGVFALRVPSDAEAPFLVTATKTPFDRKASAKGWDIVEAGSDRELEIVLRPQPPR